jgi:hypothetical protein
MGTLLIRGGFTSSPAHGPVRTNIPLAEGEIEKDRARHRGDGISGCRESPALLFEKFHYPVDRGKAEGTAPGQNDGVDMTDEVLGSKGINSPGGGGCSPEFACAHRPGRAQNGTHARQARLVGGVAEEKSRHIGDAARQIGGPGEPLVRR